jgi:hypothetical protein
LSFKRVVMPRFDFRNGRRFVQISGRPVYNVCDKGRAECSSGASD